MSKNRGLDTEKKKMPAAPVRNGTEPEAAQFPLASQFHDKGLPPVLPGSASLRQAALQRMQQQHGNQYVQRQLGQQPHMRANNGGAPVAQRIVPVVAAELGIAVFSAGAPIVLSGNFSCSAATINYIHENTPPDADWTRVTTTLRANVWNPRPFMGGNMSMYFRLSYEYNGHDLRDVSIVGLQDQSEHLTSSTFAINFTGMAHSPSSDPTAAIRYQISGTWDPVGTGIDSFWGYLQVKADGSMLFTIESEHGWVWTRADAFGDITTTPVETEEVPPEPEPPPPPEPVMHLTDVTFAPGSDVIEAGAEQALVSWYLGLPQSARRQIEDGTLQITIEGHASTTQPGPANRLLSRQRAQRVVEILQDIAGSDARFRVYSRGEYVAGTPDDVEDENERVVLVSVETIEEADASGGGSSDGATGG
ncbi:MAG: OmpA family protein [Anaerolineales bacterium]|nr:OmpA family protein [Anaerolineales bacterium]MCB8951971.1 OmpA family protein [Ardenticatenales bacterium]